MSEDRYAAIAEAFRAERFQEAERLCCAVLDQNPVDPDALYWLARVGVEAGRAEEARPYFGHAFMIRPQARFVLGMAQSLRRRGLVTEAMELIASSIERFPEDAALPARLGQLLADRGELEDAEAMFRKALSLDPASGEAFLSLALIRRFEQDDPLIQAMEQAWGQLPPEGKRRRDLAFALGRAYHDTGRYDEAFARFQVGNALRRRTADYDAERDSEQTEVLMEVFDEALVSRASTLGHRDQAPVLVVGMPRSGTTLVEQIIAAHPRAHGAGERLDLPEVVEYGLARLLPAGSPLPASVVDLGDQAWAELGAEYARRLRELAPEAERVVDKQLYNFKLLGMALLMLPDAKVVWCRRDPLDVGLSCYMSMFDSGSDFIYDLWEMGHAWRLHDELMQHWMGRFPGRILRLQYEELIADAEAGSRTLIEHLELPWDDACLNFHEQDRDVSTLSVAQVRKPIYASSIGRWERYSQHLAPLRAGLAGEPRPS